MFVKLALREGKMFVAIVDGGKNGLLSFVEPDTQQPV